MSETLLEYCDSRGLELRIDAELGVLRGVKILGPRSRNGRVYPADTLLRAAPLYEGAKVNVNHPPGNPAGPRDYRDRIGVMRNVAARADAGLFGDLHFNPKHALAEQLAWDAEHAPENVGFSHNVEARVARRGEEWIVEEILTVQGVDLVADPATTRGLFESCLPPAGVAWNELTAQSLLERRPDLVEAATTSIREELAAARVEVEQLRLASAMQEREERARALLREHGLPQPEADSPWAKALVSETFFRSLCAAPDDEAIRRLAAERAQLMERIGVPAVESRHYAWPRSRDQFQVDVTFRDEMDAAAFVKAIT